MAQTWPDSGFTDKAEAKNQEVNGFKEGKWVEYFKLSSHEEVATESAGSLFYLLTEYIAGKPAGVVREYYKSEKLRAETFYTNGGANQIHKEYDEKGELVVVDTIKGDLGSGVIRLYYKSGKLKTEYPFITDKLMFRSKIYVASLEIFLYAQIYGIVRTYYEDGKLKTETMSVNGDESISNNYDENGTLIKSK